MAIHVYCDDPSHEDQGGKFTPAVAKIRVKTLNNSTIETIKAWDSCHGHIAIFASAGWDMAYLAPDFHEVTVSKIAETVNG